MHERKVIEYVKREKWKYLNKENTEKTRMISTMSRTTMGFVLVHPVETYENLNNLSCPLLGYIMLLMLIFIARENIFMLCSWTYNLCTLASISQSTCTAVRIRLFRGRLSEKVHVTIPKGIVDGFEFTVLQRNLKEWQERSWTYDTIWEPGTGYLPSFKRSDYAIARVSRTVYWSYPILPFGIVACIFCLDNLLEISVCKVVLTDPLFTFVRNLLIFPNRKSKLEKLAPWL